MEFPALSIRSSSTCSAAALESALQEIFSEPAAAVRVREQRALLQMLAVCANRCVVFGAGSMGRRSIAALRSLRVEPLALSDNNPQLWGSSIDGIPVLAPAEAARRHGVDAHCFIAIRNEAHWHRETHAQLQALGVKHLSSAEPICWRFPDIFPPFLPYDLPHKVYEQAADVMAAAKLWADDASRAEYLAQVRLRALGDLLSLPPFSGGESYFLDHIFKLQPGDRFVDCGAFDGDTLRGIVRRKVAFGSIEAIEADPDSFARLSEYVATLDSAVRSKIYLHRCAVGSQQNRVRFESTGNDGSKVSESGDLFVDMAPLDALLGNKPVSMIKMDIEGGEFDALMGAAHVIRRDRPILAVCVYHSQSDLWRLPLLMRSMCPDYRMYLKAYGGDGIQTVAYAVPPERVRPIDPAHKS